MDLKLQGEIALIAGASRGIGRAIAGELLAEGASVVLTGRDRDSLGRTHDELAVMHGNSRVLAVSGDLLEAKIVEEVFSRAIQVFGTINHLIVNIGTGKGTRGWNQSVAEWQRLFSFNFFAATQLAQAALPYLLSNPTGGSILFIASIVGIEATPAPLPYSAAKAALLNYSKNLSREVAAQGVRVNSIAPGNIFFEGGSWHERVLSAPDQVQRMLDNDVPLRRFGAPEEIATLAAFLCSPLSAFTTGACYITDGGQTRRI